MTFTQTLLIPKKINGCVQLIFPKFFYTTVLFSYIIKKRTYTIFFYRHFTINNKRFLKRFYTLT